ncbi:TldD/PmbA family protein [Stetteria hydrogenophila]
MSLGPDELSRLVERMASAGAGYAEARLHSIEGFSVVLMDGRVVSVGRESVEGVALRALVGGGLGFASSPLSAGWEGAVEAASRAVASARAASASPDGTAMAPARLGRARVEVAERIPLDSLSIEDKISRLVEAYKSLEAPGGLELQSVVIHYSESVERKVLVTSDGALVESRTPRVEVFYNITAKGGGRRANRWFQIGGTGGFEVLDDAGLEEAMRGDVESLAVNLLKASPPPRGVMDVVLSPELAGIIAHEAAGHPSEADRVLGREAAQAGLSFRSWMREGVIGSEYATVIDDPTIPGSFGFYLYDDEGVPARPRRLYDRGRLAELLHNRETAAVYGVESNAAARAADYKSEPIVRMANTYIAPGDYSFEELVEDVKDGVYIRKYMEWNIDDVRWGQRYVGLEAYRIRGGRLAEPVRDVVLEATTAEIFSSIDAAGRDLEFYAGTCGKGEPAQGVPVWMGGPHIRLRGVRLA